MVSRLKPVILNFDDLFMKYELHLIRRFIEGRCEPQSISNSVLSYSKTQNGSIQFFRALESIIINKQEEFSPQELSNIIYSYHKSENAKTDPLLLDLRNIVVKNLHKYKPMEMC